MTDSAAGAGNGLHRSLWLDQALSKPGTPCPPLVGNQRADIAIVGGGYVGLWTAIELKQRDRGIDVVILEQDICGAGASGRNGGYALSWWTKAPSLRAKWGDETARELIKKSEAAIDELAAFCDGEGIDAEYTKSGWVWGAFSEVHSGVWKQAVQACRELDISDLHELSHEAAVRLSGTDTLVSAVLDRTAAMLHPGKLVRGMREAALRQGVIIYEHSRVRHFSRERPARLVTANGAVRADKVILATNAWSAALPELSRSIVVVSSDIIVSRPVPDQLQKLQWLNKAGVNDSCQLVSYVRTTADGRLLAGKGGLASAYGGHVGKKMFHSPARAKLVKRQLDELYPGFSYVPVECSWSGPVDRSSDGLPLLGSLPGHEHIFYGIGWSGNGVGPSRIGGRALASLATGYRDEWSSLPVVVDRPRRDLPAEPFRYLGGHLVRAAIARKDRVETQGRHPGWITKSLASLAPRGVEDR